MTRWWNEDPAPMWVPRLVAWLIVGMIVGVVVYGFWSYR